MLKEPYDLVHEIDQNRYYVLALEGLPYAFLATEAIEKISEYTKRFLRKPKKKEVELTQSLRLMPLSSATLFLMGNFLSLTVAEEKDAGGLETETFYDMWDSFDIKDLSAAYQEMLKSVDLGEGQEEQWAFPHTVKNDVAKGFLKEEMSFFGLQTLNSMLRSYWLVKTSKTGTLVLMEVQEVGLKDKTQTMSVQTYMISRDVAKAVLEYFGHNQNEKENDE